jgi:hypothetical protein
VRSRCLPVCHPPSRDGARGAWDAERDAAPPPSPRPCPPGFGFGFGFGFFPPGVCAFSFALTALQTACHEYPGRELVVVVATAKLVILLYFSPPCFRCVHQKGFWREVAKKKVGVFPLVFQPPYFRRPTSGAGGRNSHLYVRTIFFLKKNTY